MSKHSHTRSRTTFARAAAALLALTLVRPLWAAPGDITNLPAPVLGADPPKARDIAAGDASVSTQTGAFSYSYPVTVPPGRLGVQPSLALSYSSQGANYGGIAAGWSLSIPEITLDTSVSVLDQLYAPLLFSDPEAWRKQRFVSSMAGGRPLVAVTESAASDVRQTFRAQNDGSFARYERLKEGVPHTWRARTTDGMTYYFGGLLAPASTDLWAPLTRAEDSFHNTIEYRWEGTQIAEILYTSNPAAGLSWFARVEFIYDGGTTCTAEPVGAQQDRRLGITRGRRRLVKIRSLAQDPGKPAQHTREITLAYSSEHARCDGKHAPMRVLTSLQESAWGDNATRVDLPPVSFDYGRFERTFDQETIQNRATLWPSEAEQANLGWGLRRQNGWPSVESMLLDFDGDGLMDRLTAIPGSGNECKMSWQRNLGLANGQMTFAPPVEHLLPRLPWANGDKNYWTEWCSLSAQYTMVQNLPANDTCPLSAGSYLAYRWLDMTGDQLPDLVTAIHHDPKHFDPNAGSWFGSWPTCDGSSPPCPVLSSSCMDTATVCPDKNTSCRADGATVATCLKAAPRVQCNGMIAGPDGTSTDECLAGCNSAPNVCAEICDNVDRIDTGPAEATCGQQTPHERCDRYPWMIYENLGGILSPTAQIKYQPVQLESDGGDSAFGGGRIASPRHAILDIDGDGNLDALVRGRYSEQELDIPKSNYWWLIFRGDGNGNFVPADPEGTPYVWVVPKAAPIAGSCGSSPGGACSVLSRLPDESPQYDVKGLSTLIDMNGDGISDLVWKYAPDQFNATDAMTTWRPVDDADPLMFFTNNGLQFEFRDSFASPDGMPLAMAGVDHFSRSRVDASAHLPSHFLTTGQRESMSRFVDIDHDGRPDLVEAGRSGGSWETPSLFINGGGSLLAPSALTSQELGALQQTTVARPTGAGSPREYGWYQTKDLVDLDGDGLPESWWFEKDAVRVRRDSERQPMHLMKRIVNGRGGSFEVTYAPTTQASVVVQNPTTRQALPHAQWVVASLVVRDTWDADRSETKYQYSYPVWKEDDEERWGFRGFEEVTTTSPSHARVVETYDFDVDWSGRLEASRTFSTEDTAGPRSISETTWAPLTLFDGAIKTFHTTHTRSWSCANGQTEAQCKDANAGFLHTSWAYQQLPTTGTAQIYYANQIDNLDTESYVVGGRRNLVTMVLYSDATNYRLREKKSLQAQLTSLTPLVETFYSYTVHWYDPAYKARTSSETYFDLDQPVNRAVTTWHQDPATGVTDWVRSPRNYPDGPTESFLYDPTKRFVTTTTNEVGHVVVSSYEPGTGALLTQQGPNSSSCGPGCTNREQTWSDVDGLGRATATYANVAIGGSSAWQKTKVSRATYTDAIVSGARTKVVAESLIEYGVDRWTREETRLDGQGRPDEVIVNTDLTPDAITTYDYDKNGHLVEVTMPDPSQAASTATVTYKYTYDSIGRPTSMRRPLVGGTVASGIDLSYNGLVHQRDEVVGSQGGPAARTVLHHDNFGRLVAVHEYTDSSTNDVAKTSYLYDAGDNVRRIDNPDGVVTELFHDFEDRRVRIVRNNKTWSYGYYPGGEMASEAVPPPPGGSPLAYTTTYAYDPLGRPSSRSVGIRTMAAPAEQQLFGVGTIQFAHDTCTNGTGRLCSVTFPHGVLTTSYVYDAEGNTKTELRGFNFAGVTGVRSSSAIYGPGGRVAEQTYADNSSGASDATRAKFAYDDRGLPRSIDWIQAGVAGTRSAAIQTRNVAGLVTSRVAGTLVAGWRQHTSTWTYDKLTRVESQTITNNLSQQLARQQLEYFGQDDPKRLQHWMGTSYYKLDFGYDRRHQLRTVKEAGGRFDAEYRFSPAGKLSYTRIGIPGTSGPGSDVIPREVNYAYGSPTNPEAATALVNVSGGANFRSYAYDSVGNMATRSDGTTNDAFLYDGEDQLRRASVTTGSTSTKEEYFYDHGGQRTAVVTRNAAGAVATVRVFMGDSEILLTPGAATKTYAHLSLGTPVARVTNRTDIEFQYQGLSSNTLLSVKPDGSTKSGFVYAPYGELLEAIGSDIAEQHRRFNDKFRDDATKLSYYGVRYYDGVLLGWTQADPLYRFTPDSAWAEPRRSLLWTFSGSNPVRYVDPDGRDTVESLALFVAETNPVSALPTAIVFAATGDPGHGAAIMLRSTAIAASVACGGCTAGLLGGGLLVGGSTLADGGSLDEAGIDAVTSVVAGQLIGTGFKVMQRLGGKVLAKQADRLISASGGCFVAGTLVSTQVGLREIEDIVSGDFVWSANVATGEVALRRVSQTYVIVEAPLVEVAFNVNPAGVLTTPEHPFWTTYGWVLAKNLTRGDVVFQRSGERALVESVRFLGRSETVYNLEVEGVHTYYVGPAEILVHNTSSIKPRPGTVTASGQAAAPDGTRLGPSGKPMYHYTRTATRKQALDAAQQQSRGGTVVKDTATAVQPQHYHAVKPDGQRVTGPSKSHFTRRGAKPKKQQ